MNAYQKLLQLPCDAVKMLAPMRDLFSLGLRRKDHELLCFDEGEFTTRDLSGDEWRFTGAERAPGLAVKLTPRLENGMLFVGFAVAGVPDDCALEWIEPLRLRVANPHGDLLLTHHEGEIVHVGALINMVPLGEVWRRLSEQE